MNKITDKITHWEWLKIAKPARYMGGEVNQTEIKTNPQLRVCLIFPDLYELGMSNLAIKIFYEILNNQPEIMAERAFSPWVDLETLLRKKGLPLFSLETATPLNVFDALFISLPYEMTFTNVVNLLDLSNIPIRWKERNSGPLIIAGGPSAANPLPVSTIMDAVLIGDGEEAIVEICQKLLQGKSSGSTISETRKSLKSIEGMWVPQFPDKVKRRIFTDFSKSTPPEKLLIPNVQTVHNRAPLEIFRGCVNGCRFCNAGFYYRPKRERNVDCLAQSARRMLENTGEESLGLLSLSTSDYSQLPDLVSKLEENKIYPEQKISIPSMRMNENTIKLLKNHKGALTFAPEAGSQRLRNIICKNVTEKDIFDVIEATRDINYRTLKLYFMMGLPFESQDDLDAIVELVKKIEYISKKMKPRKQISISLSGFIPKPFTPFQWCKQASMDELKNKRITVNQGLRNTRARLSWRDEYLCMLEAVLSRGDESVSELIIAAHKAGCRFDGWNELFNRAGWEKAFKELNFEPEHFSQQFSLEKMLPWDFIDFQVPRSFLESEYQKAAEIAGESIS
ncbi:MAG: radical SAM protein [Candidatus Rifleibacteriota bacterium]